MEFNVMSFGAIGNGIASDTQAIQAAIDACRQNGGGRVVCSGTPETVANCPESYTGQYLKKVL